MGRVHRLERSWHQPRAADIDTRRATRTGKRETAKPSKRRVWRIIGVCLLILAVLGGIARAIMPWAVRDYVNRTLDRNPMYAGKIGDVRIQLWRGAYSIDDITISKTTGNVPVPFFAAKRVDFAIQWDALLHRKVVGRVLMQDAELNFVDAPTEGEDQTGARPSVAGHWTNRASPSRISSRCRRARTSPPPSSC